jgi:hypothetical protein
MMILNGEEPRLVAPEDGQEPAQGPEVLCCGECGNAFSALVNERRGGSLKVVGLVCAECSIRLWVDRSRVLEEPPFWQRLKLMVGGVA